MALFNLDKKKKLLIIGLDGVPLPMIQDMTARSLMPRLKEILDTSTLVQMEVSIPEISSVSWSSFMTGTDPGNHGIFGFVELEPGKYRYRFPDFRDLQSPTFFDELGNYKKRSVIINLPATYPAREIPGVLISGFVALDLQKAVYPASLFPFLRDLDYQIDVETQKAKADPRGFIVDLHRSLEKRMQAADHLWRREKWDLFMFTVTETDRLHHFFYDAYTDPAHALHEDFHRFYREIDRIIGDLYQRIAGKEQFEMIILSDHGFGPIQNEVYLTPILKKNGFFQADKEQIDSLESISPRARAFALDPSRIYIHRQGKYPRGFVQQADYEKIRQDLRQLFEEYRIDGQKVIKKVFYKEEIYSERFLAQAPDLVLLSQPGFDLKGGLKKNTEYGRSHFTGMHLQDNAFFLTTCPQFLPPHMTIFQAKPHIFQSLGIS